MLIVLSKHFQWHAGKYLRSTFHNCRWSSVYSIDWYCGAAFVPPNSREQTIGSLKITSNKMSKAVQFCIFLIVSCFSMSEDVQILSEDLFPSIICLCKMYKWIPNSSLCLLGLPSIFGPAWLLAVWNFFTTLIGCCYGVLQTLVAKTELHLN